MAYLVNPFYFRCNFWYGKVIFYERLSSINILEKYKIKANKRTLLLLAGIKFSLLVLKIKI